MADRQLGLMLKADRELLGGGRGMERGHTDDQPESLVDGAGVGEEDGDMVADWEGQTDGRSPAGQIGAYPIGTTHL
jgi:hypothetical protein